MSHSWKRWMPLLIGVIFVVLVGVGVAMTWNTPDTKDSATKVLAYYQAHKSKDMAGSYLIALSLFFGLFFFGSLRNFLRGDLRSEPLASVAFGGGILFAVGGALVAGTGFALSDRPHAMSAQVAQTLNFLASDLEAPALIAALGVILFATGLAVVRAGLLPRWVGWASMVLGVVSLTPIGWLMMVALAILVVIVGVRIAKEADPELDELPVMPAPPMPPMSVGG